MTPRNPTILIAGIIAILMTLALSAVAPAQTANPISAEEAKALTHMREEEKLAHDVYAELYAKWKLRVFSNISHSEARHFDAIGVLLARYEVADPSKDLPAGVFLNADLAALYKQLIEKGGLSLKDALEVGVLIERVDIEDLEAALKTTDKADIKIVYTNLLAGSLSHLDSFEQVHEAVCALQ